MPVAAPSLTAPHPSTFAASHLYPALSSLFASSNQFLREILFKTDGKTDQLVKIFSKTGYLTWLRATDPLVASITLAWWISVVCWILGELTGNLSQVDRLWTFLPVIWSAHFTFYPYWATSSKPLSPLASAFSSKSTPSSHLPQGVDPRMAFVLALQVIWSMRLTTNSIRRGFFNPKEEDYRWVHLRKQHSKAFMKVLNLTFVAFAQNALLLATAAPQYLLLTLRSHPTAHVNPLGTTDYLIGALYVSILGIEMLADNQQQHYQHFKRDPAYRASVVQQSRNRYASANHLALLDASVRRGFLTDGWWGWSRHPNFACEQSTFWVLYLFTISATLPPAVVGSFMKHLDKFEPTRKWVESVGCLAWKYGVNWSVCGAVAMTLLFYSSTLFTESISSGKYPLYKDYQASTDMFWPVLTPLKSFLLLITGRRASTHARAFGTDVPYPKGSGDSGLAKGAIGGPEGQPPERKSSLAQRKARKDQ